MHSRWLQKQYTQIYEGFFTTQQIIFSTPFILSRSGEADAHHSGVSIKQKIPLRMYIGIRSSTQKWFQFQDIIYRDLTEQKFVTRSIHEYAPYFKDVEKLIQQQIWEQEKWFQITVLSELPRWVGLGFDSILSLLIATALVRIQDRCSPTQHMTQENITEDINNTDGILYKVVRLAHTIESQIKWYQHINWAITSSLIHTAYPIVNFHEDSANLWKRELIPMFDYKYFSHPLSDLSEQISNTPHCPIDYGLIYSWRPLLNEQITQGKIENEFEQMVQFIDNVFKNDIAYISANRKPRFYKEFIATAAKKNGNIMQSILWYMSFEVLYRLKKLYKVWYTEEDIKKLLLAITKTRHAHNTSKKTSSYLTNLITWLQQYFWYKWDLLWISYNDSNVMWWCLLFVTPLEWLRKNLMNTLFQAQRDFPWSELIYASWLDGIETTGLTCEQDLLLQKTSHYISSNMLVLETPWEHKCFWSYEELIKSKDVDILLDTVHMKIYTQWSKLTSKDLHSQTGTIEMLTTALKYLNTDISNKTLPLSSYSKSKNEMVWKIVLPFIKIVKEKLQKDLPLECYWGMYDYYLRLKKHDIKFGIMRKVTELEYA